MTHLGLSQQDFAARLDLSSSSISNIFNGRTNPTIMHVNAIHRAFPQINEKWLLFGEGEMIEDENVAPSPMGEITIIDDDDDDGGIFDDSDMPDNDTAVAAENSNASDGENADDNKEEN